MAKMLSTFDIWQQNLGKIMTMEFCQCIMVVFYVDQNMKSTKTLMLNYLIYLNLTSSWNFSKIEGETIFKMD